MDPITAKQRASIAGNARWAKHDPNVAMKPVRAGFQAKLRWRVEEDAQRRGEQLSEEEVARRAQALFREHMARMTVLSKKARSN